LVTKFLLITLAYAIIIILEVPRLVAQKRWKDLGAFWLLLAPAMIYGYGMVFDLKLPNPTDFLEAVFKPAAMKMESFFGTAK